MQNASKQNVIFSESLADYTDSVRVNPGKDPGLGLCALCSNRETCVFPRSQAVLLNCDELDYPDGETCLRTPRAKRKTIRAAAPERKADSASGPGDFLGLCSTCEIREKCVFPKPEGGVWHCEEFV